MAHHTLFCCLLAVAPLSVLAETPHEVGVAVGVGGVETDMDADPSFGQTSLLYGYRFSSWVGIEVGYWTADSRRFDFLFDNDLGDGNFDADALDLSLKGIASISRRNDLYLKLGVSTFDYEFQQDDLVIEDDDGMGFVGSLGWQYSFDGGVGFQVEYDYRDLDDVDTGEVQLGITYRF